MCLREVSTVERYLSERSVSLRSVLSCMEWYLSRGYVREVSVLERCLSQIVCFKRGAIFREVPIVESPLS